MFHNQAQKINTRQLQLRKHQRSLCRGRRIHRMESSVRSSAARCKKLASTSCAIYPDAPAHWNGAMGLIPTHSKFLYNASSLSYVNKAILQPTLSISDAIQQVTCFPSGECWIPYWGSSTSSMVIQADKVPIFNIEAPLTRKRETRIGRGCNVRVTVISPDVWNYLEGNQDSFIKLRKALRATSVQVDL